MFFFRSYLSVRIAPQGEDVTSEPTGEGAGQSEIVPVDAKLDAPPEGGIDRSAGWWKAKYGRFIAAAALGSIPWIGGVFSAAIALQAEGGQERLDEMQKLWLHEHEEKISKLGMTIAQILQRLESLGDDVLGRIQSDEYLGLIRKGFKAWDRADTEEKREFIRKFDEASCR